MATTKGNKKTEPVEPENGQEVAEEETAVADVIVVPQVEVDAVLRHHTYAAMAIGLAPVPVVDLVGLSIIQVDLVRALAKKYEVPFRANLAKTLVSALVGGVLPIGIAPLFASLVKLVPVVGLTTGAASMCILGGASTHAVGRVFAAHFASGGTLLTFKAENVQASFKRQFEKGKSVVTSMKKKDTKKQESTAPEAEAQTA